MRPCFVSVHQKADARQNAGFGSFRSWHLHPPNKTHGARHAHFQFASRFQLERQREPRLHQTHSLVLDPSLHALGHPPLLPVHWVSPPAHTPHPALSPYTPAPQPRNRVDTAVSRARHHCVQTHAQNPAIRPSTRQWRDAAPGNPCRTPCKWK